MENSPPPPFFKPGTNETPELTNHVEIQTNLVFNNTNYNLEIDFDKSKTEIVFLIDEKENFSTEYYTTKINLETFVKLSKYFRLCDTIDEVMDCLKTIFKNLRKENEEYNLDFYIKNNEAILKYSAPVQTGKILSFEFLLEKKERSKDLIIEKLKDRIKDLEDGYFVTKKVYENETQNEICQIFKKIRNNLNKKELELHKKFEELSKKSKVENFSLYYEKDFINKINNTINDISIIDHYYFKWKNGANYTLDENKLIATKISGGDTYNCTIIGDKILPKNSIVSWKIKLKKFEKGFYLLIGIGPENLNQNMEEPFNDCWTFACHSSVLCLKSGKGTSYKTGKLKTNDIVEVKVDTSKGILSFGVNGEDYGVACDNIPNVNLCPVVLMYSQKNSIELIE